MGKMSLQAQYITITNSHDLGEYTHATSTLNLGSSAQRTRSRKCRADHLYDHISSL